MSESQNPSATDLSESPTRRRVITMLSLGLGALVGAVASIGPLGVLLDPILRKTSSDADTWISLGTADRFSVGGPPVRVSITQTTRDAWLTLPANTVGFVFVERTSADEFRLLSGTCPHLGCPVGINEGGFLCPCHQSSFALDGSLRPHEDGSANPAPRPLDTLAWRVRMGALEVDWVRYKPGEAEQVVI